MGFVMVSISPPRQCHVVPHIRQKSYPSAPFPIYYTSIIPPFNTTKSKLLTMSLNESQITSYLQGRWQGLQSGQSRYFSLHTIFRLALHSTQFLIQWITQLKKPDCKADQEVRLWNWSITFPCQCQWALHKSARVSSCRRSNSVTTSCRRQSLRWAASGFAMREWYASWWCPSFRWWENTIEWSVGRFGSSGKATLIAVLAMLITQSLHLCCSNILITCIRTSCYPLNNLT